jgi:hypothetical protein
MIFLRSLNFLVKFEHSRSQEELVEFPPTAPVNRFERLSAPHRRAQLYHVEFKPNALSAEPRRAGPVLTGLAGLAATDAAHVIRFGAAGTSAGFAGFAIASAEIVIIVRIRPKSRRGLLPAGQPHPEEIELHLPALQ